MAYQGTGNHSPPGYDDGGHRLQDLPAGNNVSLHSLWPCDVAPVRKQSVNMRIWMISSMKKKRLEDCYRAKRAHSQVPLMTPSSAICPRLGPPLDTA